MIGFVVVGEYVFDVEYYVGCFGQCMNFGVGESWVVVDQIDFDFKVDCSIEVIDFGCLVEYL